MIPILFDKTATSFDTNGLGLLGELLSCKVTEERNGEFELEAVYPITGRHYSEIQKDCIIFARAHEKSSDSDDNPDQPFRIYKITKPMNGKVTIYARHISYQLSFVPVGYLESTAYSSETALTALKDAIIGDCPFTFSSDLAVSGKTWGVEKPISVRSALGGDDGYLDTFGGEVLWDKYTVKILSTRGKSNSVTVRYGKNLTDVQQEENIESVYTAIMGYYRSDDKHIDGNIQKLSADSDYQYSHTYIYDCTSVFNDTVKNGYRKGTAFYSDSNYKTVLTPTENYYYVDQSTILNAYYNGTNMFTDSQFKKQLTDPQTDKYYLDNNAIQRGYIKDGYFYKSSSDAEKGDTSKAEVTRTHVIYVDQSNDTEAVYYYRENAKDFQLSRTQEDYSSIKVYYIWTGSAWQWYETYYPDGTTGSGNATAEIQNYLWQYVSGAYTKIGIKSDRPIQSDIDRLALAYMNDEDNNFGVPDVSLTMTYQPLWETEEYKDLAAIEAVHLCDTVTVIFDKLGVNTTAKVTKTVYNVLMDRYDSVEINSDWEKDKKNNLAATIANQSNTIKKEMDIQSSDLAAAILDQTALITGGRGGYVKLMYNDSGQPDELLIMDSPDYTNAHYVMRFNKNGIGFSQNGYEGPFNSAWTIDGNFSANWITTGLLTAITMQTASSGDRLVIRGRNNAVFGYTDDTVVNILDMMGGDGTTATIIIDSPNALVIRTPEIDVTGISYGTGSGTATKTLSEPISIVSDVKKNMTYGTGLQSPHEVFLNDCGSEGNPSVYCVLPVFLDVEKKDVTLVNGFITGTDNVATSVI